MIKSRRSIKKDRVKATSRQVDEQILYAKDEFGHFKCSVKRLYDDYICVKKPEYAKIKFNQDGKKVVCPFHDDVLPSLGVVTDKDTGIEVFNCFGCGAKGTVITMYDKFQKDVLHRSGDTGLFREELAKLFGVSVSFELSQKELDNYNLENAINLEDRRVYDFNMHRANVMKLVKAKDSLTVGQLAELVDQITEKSLEILKEK